MLLVEDVPQVAQYIRNLLSAQTQVKLLDVVTDGSQVLDQIRELRPDVLVVDALLRGRMNGLEVAENARRAGFSVPIIALTVPQKPVQVGEGMGITRVLSMPFSGFDFMKLLQSVHAELQAQAPDAISRVLALYGSKGGVGTTTLAYNIAAAMAQGGRQRVALVDGSLQFADVRVLLRVPETAPSILQLPTDRVQESDLAEALWRDPSGVDILLAPPRVEMAEMVSTRDVEKLLSLLRRVYNVVVIDTPTTVNDLLLTLLDQSDQVIQVVTTEATSLHNAAVMARTFAAIGYPPEKVRYLLNRAGSAGGLSRGAVTDALGRAPDFEVSSDGPLVVDANNQGVPFVLAQPGAGVSREVQQVATALTGRQALAAAARR